MSGYEDVQGGVAADGFAVPALPGAIKSWLHFGLCANFQAKALSLPPEPRIRIFIVGKDISFSSKYLVSSISVCNRSKTRLLIKD